MVDFRQFNSVDAVVAEVQDDYSGTVFEHEFLAFENFESYVQFRIDSDERFLDSWVARIGEASDFRDMFGLFARERDEGSLKKALGEAEGVSYLDALKFARDVLKYRRNEIVEGSMGLQQWGEDEEFSKVSDSEVVESIVQLYNFPGVSDDAAAVEVREFLNGLRGDRGEFQMMVSELFELQGEGAASIDASVLEEMPLSDFIGFVLDEEINALETEMGRYRFGERVGSVEVGDYFVHLTPFVESALDELDGERSEQRVFQMLLEVTDVYTVLKDGVEIVNFEYDVVRVDDAVSRVFPGHYIAVQNIPLGPENQGRVFRLQGSVESFETRCLLDESPYEELWYGG